MLAPGLVMFPVLGVSRVKDLTVAFFSLTLVATYSLIVSDCVSATCKNSTGGVPALVQGQANRPNYEAISGELIRTWTGELGNLNRLRKTKTRSTCLRRVGSNVQKITTERARPIEFAYFQIGHFVFVCMKNNLLNDDLLRNSRHQKTNVSLDCGTTSFAPQTYRA